MFLPTEYSSVVYQRIVLLISKFYRPRFYRQTLSINKSFSKAIGKTIISCSVKFHHNLSFQVKVIRDVHRIASVISPPGLWNCSVSQSVDPLFTMAENVGRMHQRGSRVLPFRSTFLSTFSLTCLPGYVNSQIYIT